MLTELLLRFIEVSTTNAQIYAYAIHQSQGLKTVESILEVEAGDLGSISATVEWIIS